MGADSTDSLSDQGPTGAPDDPRLAAFVDGRLPPEEAEDIARRAETDPVLRAEIALVQALKRDGATRASALDLEAGWGRLNAALDREAGRPRTVPARPRFAVWHMAAAAALAAVIGAGLHAALAPTVAPSGATYHLAEGPAIAGWTARAAFVETAPEGELRAALRAVGAEIVAGPSAVGVYDLAFASEAARTQGVAALAARADIVQSIAPVTSPPPP